MELKKYKLGEIAYFVEDKISSNEISLNEYITTDCLLQNKKGRTIATNLPPQSCSLTKFQKEDILIGNIRPYLKKIWFADIDGGCSLDVLVLRSRNKNESTYLFSILMQDSFFDFVMKATKGSKMPRGDKNHILNFLCFDISNKIKIGNFIKSLDDKIALNRRINAELEAMAKELYDYYFVQFDFPNADGKPYKSSGGKMVYSDVLKREIPEGWEVKKLGEFISKIDSGKRPSGGIDKSLKYGIPSLGAECIDDLGVFDFSATPFVDFSYKKKMTTGKIENNDILIYKDGAYVGKTTLFRDDFPYKEAFVNEHVFLIHAKKEEFEEYLYFTLTQKTYFQIMQNLGKAKAAQPGLNREDLMNILLIIPSNNLISDFNKKVKSLFAQVFNNAKAIGNLTALRDELLPLLMNGQVEVR